MGKEMDINESITKLKEIKKFLLKISSDNPDSRECSFRNQFRSKVKEAYQPTRIGSYKFNIPKFLEEPEDTAKDYISAINSIMKVAVGNSNDETQESISLEPDELENNISFQETADKLEQLTQELRQTEARLKEQNEVLQAHNDNLQAQNKRLEEQNNRLADLNSKLSGYIHQALDTPAVAEETQEEGKSSDELSFITVQLRNLTEMCKGQQELLDVLAKRMEVPTPEMVAANQTQVRNQPVSARPKETQAIPEKQEMMQAAVRPNPVQHVQRPVPPLPHTEQRQGVNHTEERPVRQEKRRPQPANPAAIQKLSASEQTLVDKYNKSRLYRPRIKFKLSPAAATERANELKGYTTMEVARQIPFVTTTGEGIYFGEARTDVPDQFYVLPLRSWRISYTWIQNNAVEDVFSFQTSNLAGINTMKYELVKPAVFAKVKDKDEYHLVTRGVIKPL